MAVGRAALNFVLVVLGFIVVGSVLVGVAVGAVEDLGAALLGEALAEALTGVVGEVRALLAETRALLAEVRELRAATAALIERLPLP